MSLEKKSSNLIAFEEEEFNPIHFKNEVADKKKLVQSGKLDMYIQFSKLKS